MPIDFEGLRAALADRYALECELGHGTAATVFLAHDQRVGKKVAVKVLDPDLALVVRSERFLREMDYTAQLNHPNILAITDRGVAYDQRTGREILYYVTPYAEDGTLADRIAQRGPLPVNEALAFAEEIADALAYAHGKGLIHRDIKPANILMVSGHACVADFGIARTIAGEEEGLTVTGGLMGTPAYMSPEQDVARGIDHRVDLYALGCVLYEMLTGRLPFEGPTAQHIALQRRSGPAPLVRKSRRGVPLRVERLVAKALAMKAEDRFASASEFRAAIARARHPALVPLYVAAAAAALGVAIAWFGPDLPLGSRKLDPLTYAVLPFEGPDSMIAARLSSSLRDALLRWDGIVVVDPRSVAEALPGTRQPLSSQQAMRTARAVRAGRFLRSEATMFGDSLRVHVALYHTQSGTRLRERSARLPASLVRLDTTLDVIVDRVLFADSAVAGHTWSYPARLAQERGLAAVREWDLDAADSGFAAAAHYDATYASAHVWLAQVRYWKGAPAASWASAAERGAAGRSQLSAEDGSRSTALLAFARGDLTTACPEWRRLTRVAANDFAPWYGLGVCLHADRAVVRDGASITGWRFRSSYQESLRAFQRAYELWPATHQRLSAGGFEAVRRLFLTSGNITRSGQAVLPDTGRFFGLAFWHGDSIAFVPFRVAEVRAGFPQRFTEGRSRAVRRLREMFHEVATAWRSSNPQSAVAREALAISLEMLGDPSSLDTLIQARRLSHQPEEQLRFAASEVWMRVKFAIPLDLAGLRHARSLADSILKMNASYSGAEATLLASLAALTGRADMAARLARAATGVWRPPGPIARTAPALLSYAALGGPLDSLRSLWEQVEGGLGRLAISDQEPERNEWLGRSATLMLAEYPQAVAGLQVRGDYLVDAQQAFIHGDTAAVLRILHAVQQGLRRANPPAILTFDGLFPEAALLASVGEPQQAADWLDPTLDALVETPPRIFSDPARAGALVRALALRADLAERLGDRAGAARWARVVAVLWSDADQFLNPLLEKMQRLTSGGGLP